MAWALAISNCRKCTWALAQEWALSIHPTKMTTWALTMWWALARDTTVNVKFDHTDLELESTTHVLYMLNELLCHQFVYTHMAYGHTSACTCTCTCSYATVYKPKEHAERDSHPYNAYTVVHGYTCTSSRSFL